MSKLCQPGSTVSAKIEVSRVAEDGVQESIDCTEIVENDLRPRWHRPVVIDYSMQDSALEYVAQLVDTQGGVENVLAEARFKLAELVTSRSCFVSKQLKVRDRVNLLINKMHPEE